MNVELRMISNPPTTVDGTNSTITATRGPQALVNRPASKAPPVAPMKKM